MKESPTFFCSIKGQDKGGSDETKSSRRSAGCAMIYDIAYDSTTVQIRE